MSYPLPSSVVVTSGASGGNVTVTLPSGIVNDDTVTIALLQDVGGTTITQRAGTTGWTIRQPTGVTGGVRLCLAYKVCTAGEANPAFDGAASGAWLALAWINKDCDVTTPINTTSGQGYASTDFANTSTPSNGDLGAGLTPAAGDDDNGPVTLIYMWGLNGNAKYMRAPQDDLIEIGKAIDPTGLSRHGNIIVGYRVMGATDGSTAAPTVRMYSTDATQGGNGFVFALRNKSGGAVAADCRTGLIEQPDSAAANWYGDFGAAVTSTKPDDFAATINGITVRGTKATESTLAGTVSSWGRYTTLADSTASVLVGRYEDIATTDLTGKIMSVQWYCSGGSQSSNLDTAGCLVGFKDNSGNWVVYQLRAKAQIVANAEYTSQIAAGYANVYASSGTINWADVTGIGWFLHHGSSATSITLAIKNLCFLDTAKITGGSSANPASLTTLSTALASWGHGQNARLQGAGQVEIRQSVQIGDGSTQTYFDASTQALTYPSAHAAATQPDWNVAADRCSVVLYPASSDTINLGAFGAVAPVQQALTMHASASTSASVSVVGGAFVGWAGTWKDGIAIASATFQACDPFNTKGADCTDTTWKRTTAGAGEAAVVVDTSGATLTRCTIDVTGTSAGYHLELGTSCTSITLADVTFTGTPGTDKVHVLKTSGIVTITISGSTSLAAGDVTSAGATVVISAPAIYQVVQISNLVTGSRVQIYDTTNNLELKNEVATGSTVTWTDPVAYVADRDIRVRIAYVSGASANEFIDAAIGTVGDGTPNASTLSYRANQVADAVYNANAVTGSAVTGVTFTDSTVDKMLIDISAGTVDLADLYAAWVYYASTATGIATDIDYIQAVDVSNYIYSNLIWKNSTSPSVPLKIAGGYAWDAVTEDPIDLIDTTGGTIFLAPPHVVAKTISVSGGDVVTGTPTSVAAAVRSELSTELSATLLATKLLRNKMVTNPADGTLTIYDDDSTTPLVSADIFEDAAGTQPYRGTGAERRERLA